MINTFAAKLIPANEQQRLEALHRYRLLGTDAEESFKSIAKLVSEIFKAPAAMISLVDAEVVYFSSNVGMKSSASPRGEIFCSMAILKSEVHVVENALEDPVAASNPLVCGDFGLRFYAGAPLVTHDGFMIGTVCLVDTQPRKFNLHDRTILEGLASVVMEQIELRLQNLQKSEKQVEVNDQLCESNDKLGASEQRFQHILDTMAEGVGIIDAEGQMVYANKMAQEILGLTHNEINDRTFDDPKWQNLRVDGSPLPGEEHPMAVMMQTGLPLFDQEIGVQPPDKERFYISINAAPIIDKETGKITGGIGTFMDVTNRRRILQQKDEFINVVSHELKTPVTSLKAAMQILNRIKDNPKPEIFSKMVSQSNTSLDKLSSLINDLLESSRISQGQLHLRKTTFSVGDLVNDCCSHVLTAGSHEIVLKGDVRLQVDADERQLNQVIVNLVNNAVKYAPDSKTIEICIEHLGQEVKVSVKDNGPGIPADQIPRLFDRYYRADYSSMEFTGLGLGLYISSEIIKKHGGSIGVDSVVGQGSTFWFTLPLS